MRRCFDSSDAYDNRCRRRLDRDRQRRRRRDHHMRKLEVTNDPPSVANSIRIRHERQGTRLEK